MIFKAFFLINSYDFTLLLIIDFFITKYLLPVYIQFFINFSKSAGLIDDSNILSIYKCYNFVVFNASLIFFTIYVTTIKYICFLIALAYVYAGAIILLFFNESLSVPYKISNLINISLRINIPVYFNFDILSSFLNPICGRYSLSNISIRLFLFCLVFKSLVNSFLKNKFEINLIISY